MKRAGRKLILLLVLLWPVAAWAQAPSRAEVGLPFIGRHYAPQDYRQHPQNWAVVQDHRGLTYVANNNGILVYDGVSWRHVETVTNTFVRSLAVDAEGTVYAGVRGDFGYLEPDSVGSLRYVSLFEEVAPQERNFQDVWGTHATPEGVYFQTHEHVFRWDGSGMQSWESEGVFHTSFEVHGRFYVRESGRGLLTVEGDSLRPVPDGAQFANTPIRMMAPYDDSRILIGTNKKGFFLYGEASLAPFDTEARAFLGDGNLYHGCALPGGFFALATEGNGVVIIDRAGEVVQVLDQAAELPDGVVNYVYAGQQGELWMALNSGGIAYVDVPSQLSLYDERLGLKGTVLNIQRHQGTLYVATGSGLYYLDRQPLSAATRARQQRSSFEPAPNIPPSSRALVSSEYGLLVASDGGVYRVQGEREERLTDEPAFALQTSDYLQEAVVYVGTGDGLNILHRTAQGWRIHHVPAINEEVRSIWEDIDGTLWLGTMQGAVLRVRFPHGLGAPPTVERFDREEGIPEGPLQIGSIAGEPVVATREGVYRFREAAEKGSGRFIPDTTLTSSQDSLLAFVEGEEGTLWMVYEDRVDILRRQADGTYVRRAPPALRFPKASMPQIYVEDSGVVWFGNGQELIRYDSTFPTVQDNAEIHTLVRKVATVSGEAVFGGMQPEDGLAPAVTGLSYENNDLVFSVAAPSYRVFSDNEYQYYLEGTDEGWSAWTTKPEVLYTSLWEGDYRLRVRSRTGRGVEGTEASFSFRILPPWYRTWWAYGGYLCALLFLSLGYRRYREIMQENERARHQARALARERLVNERLQQANESLEQANKLKDNFLANTSHELRTPLTAILGFTSLLKEEVRGEHREFLDIIEGNGERLLETLNALLDIARIRAGMKEVRLEPVDVGAKAQKTVRLLKPLAGRKQLALRVERPDEPVYALLDPSCLDRILQNLVGNAIKFTEEGNVTVGVQPCGDRIRLRVSDTGIGIDESFLPHLFEEFKQESTGMARSHEGSGLGLAITARLIGLMNGSIEVESTKGEGSVFTVTFPTCQEQQHLQHGAG